jgi:hypothetical protein
MDTESSRMGSPGDLFDTYDQLAQEILAGMPAGRVLVQRLDGKRLWEAVWPYTHALIHNVDRTDPVQRARTRIVNQAVNDYFDLLYEALRGRGRPAVRSARSLFDHLLNLRTIDGDPGEARRYCDHATIGDLLDLELNTPREEEFTGNTRKQVRHRLRKLSRQIRPAADAVLRKYPTSFPGRWASKNMPERAKRHGLRHDYESDFRLLSAVAHGSAGGDVGHRVLIDDRSVVRTGPAVSTCPLALRTGHRWFSMLVADSEKMSGPDATAKLWELLRTVDGILDQHRDACRAVDAALLPDELPANPVLIRVETDGRWTWLLLDMERERTIRAQPVDLDPGLQQWLADKVAAMEDANPGRTKPFIVGVEHDIHAVPVPNARWQPASVSLGEKRRGTRLDVKVPVRDPSLYG